MTSHENFQIIGSFDQLEIYKKYDPLVRSRVGLRSINMETYIVDVMVSEFLLPWLDEIFNSFDPFCFCWCQLRRFQRFLWLRCNSIYHFYFVLICFKLLFKVAVFGDKGVFIQWKKFWQIL